MPRASYTFEYMEVPEDAVHHAHPGLRWTDATRRTIGRANTVYVNNCPQTRELFQLYIQGVQGTVAIPLPIGFGDGQWADSLPLNVLPAGEYWVGLWRPGIPFTKEHQDQDTSKQTPQRFFEAHPPGDGNGHHSVVVIVEDQEQ